MNKNKKYHTIGCCGIACGLCPKYYTIGVSKCPGCFGEDFSKKHPPCAAGMCCFKMNNLEACGQCKDFPCKKFEKDSVFKDSFVTHKKMMENNKFIQEKGIEKFMDELNARIKILEKFFSEYNDGKSKNYYCLAATLLTVKSLEESIKKAEPQIKKESIAENDYKNKARILKAIISECAQKNNIELRLIK